jgi:hypothetical protein
VGTLAPRITAVTVSRMTLALAQLHLLGAHRPLHLGSADLPGRQRDRYGVAVTAEGQRVGLDDPARPVTTRDDQGSSRLTSPG